MSTKGKYETLFLELARKVSNNPTNYVRKLSRKDIIAYEIGVDEFGDIVNWAERQLDSARYVEEWLSDGESREDWFEAEYDLLLELSELFEI